MNIDRSAYYNKFCIFEINIIVAINMFRRSISASITESHSWDAHKVYHLHFKLIDCFLHFGT